MPNINFPTSPALNDQYSFEGKTWTYNGTAWVLTTTPASIRIDAAYTHANAAFNVANSGGSATDSFARSSANSASSYSNSAYIQANAAFVAANTADQKAVTSGVYANSSYIHANSAYDRANDAHSLINTSFGISITVDSFTGDNSCTTFTLSKTPAEENYTLVTLNGITQHKSAYNVSSANVVFSEAPNTNVAIEVTVFSSQSIVETSAFIKANAAFDKANAANNLAQSAYDTANAINSFTTIAANSINVVADSQNDTLTLNSANGITITANATTDTLSLGLTELAQGNTGTQIFVAQNGDDNNDGLAFSRPKRTIRAAMNAARPFTQVTIASGTYEETTPIIIPQFVQVKGDGERTCIIKPSNPNKDVFWVNNGCWISGLKFEGYLANAVCFPARTISSGTAQTGGPSTITLESGEDVLENYYRDMQIEITSGTGSGQTKNISSYNGSTKVVTVDSGWSTQPNNTSVYAIRIPLRTTPAANTNRWSTFITASPYVYVCSSGTTTGSGLVVDGSLATGNKSMVSAQFTQINVGGRGFHVLNDGYAQLVSIYAIFCDIGFLAESGGTASMGNCNVNFGNKGLVANGKGALAMTATFNGNSEIGSFTANLNNVSANTNPFFNVAATEPYVGLIGIVDGDTSGAYYYVVTSSPISSGNTTVEFQTSLANNFSSGTTIRFYQQSQLRASGQTFEFVGAGTLLSAALPRNGGVPNTSLQIVRENEGAIFCTSTDQNGNFLVSDLQIDQATGTISGRTFTKSLFAQMTPFILALEG